MACQAIICAVGIYLMEDAVTTIKKCVCDLHKACVKRMCTKRKSRIVRKVGSYMTWIHVPRSHVILREGFEDLIPLGDNPIKCNCLSNEESKHSLQLENRIEELEKELLQLQTQVRDILLKPDLKETYRCNKDESVGPSPRVVPSLPPPLPPPPPPMPPTPLVQTSTPLVTVKPKSSKVVEKDSTSTIMEELSKRPPKLRHVERSPGGRPIRSAPTPTDPSDILAAVLRKRFEAIHGENQECYMLSPENNKTFQNSRKSPMITGH